MLMLDHLTVRVGGKLVVNGVSLTLNPGQVHALMGPNGSGKSSLAHALMGHPQYVVASTSQFSLNDQSLLDLSPDERAHAGLFLAFQHPQALPGVSVQNALKAAYEAIHCSGCTINDHHHCPKLSVTTFRQQLQTTAVTLNINPALLTRSLNDGFSGGEKKRLEMLTLLTLKPKYAILDEIDSGLDIDSLKLVAQAIKLAVKHDQVGMLLITHYRRILDHVKPSRVSVMVNGQLVKTDGPTLLDQIDKNGYRQFS